MKKYYLKISKLMFNIILFAAMTSVNVTCGSRYYQEKLDDQLEKLRKYNDE